MKNIIKIIMIFILAFSIFYTTNAWINWLDSINWVDKITDHSLGSLPNSWDIAEDSKDLWFKILTVIKYIVSWLLIVYLVYAWAQMIMSMWSDEDKLSTWKRQLWYALVWLIFINIPWTIYEMFNVSNKSSLDGSISWTWSSELSKNEESIFINTSIFDNTVNWWIVSFIEVAIFSIAVFMIVLAGIQIMTSRWRDEKITEAKNKIVWSIVWLVFVWFIEAWLSLVYNGSIEDWKNLFQTIEELALFFAWPIAIFFLTLAWYYYITSNGDEERVKKAKSIIVNTVVATVILLASHAFLKDLISLQL